MDPVPAFDVPHRTPLTLFPALPIHRSAGREGSPRIVAIGGGTGLPAVLEGLCPVLLINSEYDDLRASAEVFAGQLAVAGIDVRQVMARGMLHGFLNLHAGVEPVAQALDLMAEVVAGASTRKA